MKQKNHRQNFCGLNSRRVVALNNLQETLHLQHKNIKNGAVELTDADKKRIQKEIDILKSKIVSNEVAQSTRHKRQKK